jgi:acyl-CoA dehydrogenase
MSDSRSLLTDLADGLFKELRGAPLADAWPKIAEVGFATLLVDEARGGFGGDWGDVFAVMRAAGQHALAAPLGETIVAHKLLSDAGIEAPDGPLTLLVDGERVPWGRDVQGVVTVSAGEVLLYTAAACTFDPGTSPAEEPRDRVTMKGDPAARGASVADVRALGAFLRVAQAAGALDTILALSINHANTRVQFGKPLAKLQAVQQNLAALAAEAAAVNVAGQAAALALDFGEASFEIAAAKLRANKAIGIGVAIAHQVHGAIGFTQDYDLHPLTKRLMGWRSEFGNDAYWSGLLGQRVAEAGGAGLWQTLTERTDRLSLAF